MALARLVLAAMAATALHAESLHVAVTLNFDAAWSDRVAAGMASEVNRIFADVPVHFEWATVHGVVSLGSVDRIVSVFLDGDCTAGPPGILDGAALAQTAVEANVIQPLVEVHCGRVAAVLGQSLIGQQRLGTALGRVLAHELYHYFTQERHHRDSALFGAQIGASSLVTKSVEFTDAELEQLTRALSGPERRLI